MPPIRRQQIRDLFTHTDADARTVEELRECVIGDLEPDFLTLAYPGELLEPAMARLHVLGIKVALAVIEVVWEGKHSSDEDRSVAVALSEIVDALDVGIVFQPEMGRFALVMPAVDLERAMEAVARIRAVFEAVHPRGEGAPRLVIGVAAGTRHTCPATVFDAAVSAVGRAHNWGEGVSWGQVEISGMQEEPSANDGWYETLRHA